MNCPVCEYPLDEHIGGKPCIISPPSTAKNIWDLPIFGRFWTADGKDLRA